jgi:hypothetical protein
MRLSCSGTAVEQSQQIVKRIWCHFLLLFRGAVSNLILRPPSPGMEMPAKRQQSSQDEADGNPQPFREFDSITQRHRGGGLGLPPLRCTLPSNEGGRNAEDTSDHDGR